MTEVRAQEARRLRIEEGLSTAQIRRRLGVSKETLYDWLRGVPAPEWTQRPNAKDDLRDKAPAARPSLATLETGTSCCLARSCTGARAPRRNHGGASRTSSS